MTAADHQGDTAYRLRRTADELYRRALDGPGFYAVGCFLVASLGTKPWTEYPWHGLAALIFLVAWWLRRQHRVAVQDEALPAWLQRHFLHIQVCGLLWSLLLWQTGRQDGVGSTSLLVALLSTAVAGLVTASLVGLNRAQGHAALAALLLPAMVLMAFDVTLQALSVTLLVFGLYLWSAGRRWYQSFAHQLDLEVQLRASRAEIERLTLQDPLTGLANRRALDLQLPQTWDQAHRRRESLSLLALDIDHFKRVNDQFGHAVGDACLRHFAALLREHFRRADDLPLRIGGEEFVVLLQDTPIDVAAELAERFRDRVQASPCMHGGQSLACTVSIGVACARWDGQDDADHLLRRADAACYLAKHAGRNRVQTSH
ncbi:MAG: GGDEF domain-containing protein [Burkholderiales bacterium]|nr:GGDEF domain-containing protein [Burkholderiales bacterium]